MPRPQNWSQLGKNSGQGDMRKLGEARSPTVGFEGKSRVRNQRETSQATSPKQVPAASTEKVRSSLGTRNKRELKASRRESELRT